MARSHEKAMSTLSRWRQAQAETVPTKRPYLAELCEDLQDAEKWRKQIIGEISNLVMLIQNAGLGEFKLRDMNDHINKLLREKSHWERRIIELGGPNYRNRPVDNEDGMGTRNYKYFGAARDLPGVRELFAKPEKDAPRKTKAELLKFVDCDYFGYCDEDDGVIINLEASAEKKTRLIAMRQDLER